MELEKLLDTGVVQDNGKRQLREELKKTSQFVFVATFLIGIASLSALLCLLTLPPEILGVILFTLGSSGLILSWFMFEMARATQKYVKNETEEELLLLIQLHLVVRRAAFVLLLLFVLVFFLSLYW